jgi:hypothetical protein
MRYLSLLLLSGCCAYVEPGELRQVGSSIGDGVPERPQWIMLYDPRTKSFYEVDRQYWEAVQARNLRTGR